MALVCSTVSATAQVNTQKTVVCFPVKTLMAELKKYGEEVMVIGRNSSLEDVIVSVFVSQETATFTIVEMDREIGCVISMGDKVHYRFPRKSSL